MCLGSINFLDETVGTCLTKKRKLSKSDANNCGATYKFVSYFANKKKEKKGGLANDRIQYCYKAFTHIHHIPLRCTSIVCLMFAACLRVID